MVAPKIGVAARINEIELHAHLTHCHGHALQLAVDETIKTMEIMRGTLDAAFELNKTYQILYGLKIIEKKSHTL